MHRLAVLTLVFVAAGCSLVGDDGATLEPGELKELVLQPDDLPPVFSRFDEGRQISADSPGGSRTDPARFGRTEGWKARYRRIGSSKTPGPLVIESRADLFESADGAGDELDAARQDLTAGELGWQPIDEPGLGDESFAATLGQAGLRFYEVFWRDANASASVRVEGFEGRIPLADVLELARKQERRISDAAD